MRTAQTDVDKVLGELEQEDQRQREAVRKFYARLRYQEKRHANYIAMGIFTGAFFGIIGVWWVLARLSDWLWP